MDLRRRISALWKLVDTTLDGYSKDRGDLLAAALAFYALLSLAPLIIVAVAVAGLILGTGTARTEISRLMTETMGAGGAQTVDAWVNEASQSGGWASLVGVVLALLAASRLAAQVRSALNQIWNVDVYVAENFRAGVRSYVSRRAFALAMVLASGPLLLAIVVARAVWSGVSDVLFADSPVAGLIIGVTQFLFSIALVTVLTAVVFKAVPDKRVGWRPVWVGALLTSVLFNLGNLIVGLYLGRATTTAAYGAAGSAVVVLLWTYFSAQFFLFGAEFTQTYAERPRGTRAARPVPSPDGTEQGASTG